MNLNAKLKDIQIIGKMTPKHGPYLPRLFFEIGMSQKGCSRTYNKLMTAQIYSKMLKKYGKLSSVKNFHMIT